MSEPMLRFDVFGLRVGLERRGATWLAFWLGEEGKRRPADFVVPDFIAEDELAQYLRDLFHESASDRHPDVVRLP